MTGLELVAGYLVAWAVRKAARVGKRLDKQADEIIDAELDRLHDVVTEKLGLDPALEKLELEAAQGQQPSDRTLRRVQDALEEATEEDPQFRALLEAVLAKLEEASGGASSVAGIDLRAAKGVQVGNHNAQTNTFN
jgi:F0F1-type ATP synthase membrane subunit b/b'